MTGVSREESAPHQKAIEKFHWNRIPAHIDSMPIGYFRELLFGTAPKGAAPAGRRRRLRRTGSVEVEPHPNIVDLCSAVAGYRQYKVMPMLAPCECAIAVNHPGQQKTFSISMWRSVAISAS